MTMAASVKNKKIAMGAAAVIGKNDNGLWQVHTN